ncbi:methyl-accepting chemotaxis protein [Celerinatantimonas sp. YJH-8]|uniref:methyl-accepting chemotaxis protein n=1 Tax=Celerinatantimonas sp. YJH-8 TaxID=3228714 RepID=UPI0038C45F45
MTMSLRTKILAVSMAAVVITAVYLVFESTSSATRQLRTSLLSDVQHFAGAYGNSVGYWVKSRQEVLGSLASQLEDNPEPSPYPFILQAYHSGQFSLTYFGNNDGQMFRQDPAIDKSRPNYDPRQKGWYKTAMAAAKPTIIGPIVSSTTHELGVILTHPVLRNGEPYGVIGANLTLSQLSAQTASLNVPGSGSAMIVGPKDLVIAYSDKAAINKAATTISAQFTQANLSQIAQQNALAEESINGKVKFIYSQNIPNTNWLLVFIMDKSELMAPVYHVMTRQIITAGILLILFGLLLYFGFKVVFRDLQRVSNALSEIAQGKGDLTSRIHVKNQDEIGRLANGFNQFVEHMHGVVSRLNEMSNQLKTEASAVAHSADNSSSRVHSQQQEIELIATAVTEMNSATQEIAGNAESTAHAANESVEMGRKGNDLVEKSRDSTSQLAEEVKNATTYISELEQHAQQINGILQTITEIAEQTNLLALNAAIEAARAGDHGRGFAVVADEVRTLSQRTHSSTEEIQKMIEMLQASTRHAVSVMERSGSIAQTSVDDANAAAQSLQEIAGSIEQISNMATQIATAAEEQTTVTEEISHNSESLRQVAGELADESQTGVDQANRLHQLAEQVSTEVNRFKI